jgi:hypothetical protein
MQHAIRYDLLVQDALRGMVRDLMSKAAREGLPGDHHFFVTFKTHAPGVQLSSRMKAQYPEEITIVSERQFEVGLSFSNIPERLVVPFSALTGFHDPSVPFTMKFEPKEEDLQALEPVRAGPRDVAAGPVPKVAPRMAQEKIAAEKPALQAVQEPAGGETKPADGEQSATKVVSIDAFRKKP